MSLPSTAARTHARPQVSLGATQSSCVGTIARTSRARTLLVRLDATLQMSPHEPLPRRVVVAVDPHALVERADGLAPRLGRQECVQALDDDDAVVRRDRERRRVRVAQLVREGREGECGRRRRGAQLAHEGDVGARGEGEGGAASALGKLRVLWTINALGQAPLCVAAVMSVRKD